MAELDPFGVPAGGPALGNGVAGEEDPAAPLGAAGERDCGYRERRGLRHPDGGALDPSLTASRRGFQVSAGAFGAKRLLRKLGPQWVWELCVTLVPLHPGGESARKTSPGPVIRKPRLGRPSPSEECVWALMGTHVPKKPRKRDDKLREPEEAHSVQELFPWAIAVPEPGLRGVTAASSSWARDLRQIWAYTDQLVGRRAGTQYVHREMCKNSTSSCRGPG